MINTLIIGTRGSMLALWQAAEVKKLLEAAYPALEVITNIIKTKGDKITDSPLAKIGGKGLFVKELEDALLKGDIDIAVHSVKDIPTKIPPELTMAAYLQREDPRDVLISRSGAVLADLPEAAVIGTSSLRRSSQILAIRPDVSILPLRGNLDTRLRKLHEGPYQAIIVAAAGMLRLGFSEQITQFLPPDIILPAVGQGAIGVESRSDRHEVRRVCEILDHSDTRVAVQAERGFLDRLEGGCQVPVAAHAWIMSATHISMTGLISNLDGSTIFRESMTGLREDATTLGRSLAQKLLDAGGEEILWDILEQQE